MQKVELGKTVEPQKLRACVIGAGPAGLYASKFLAENGADVWLFEKDRRILGRYFYSRNPGAGNLESTISSPRVRLDLNTHSSQIRDEECDFYVCATGGNERETDVEGKELAIKAMDIIRRCHGMEGSEHGWDVGLGGRLCIVGMGNVTMDLLTYLQNRCDEITVLSRSGLCDAAFDNHRMREVVESGEWNINVVDGFLPTKDRIAARRYSMLRPFASRDADGILIKVWRAFKMLWCRPKPLLNLVFGTAVERLDSTPHNGSNGVKVRYRVGSDLKEQVFDSVISSIGFVPNVPDIITTKPIYHVGWCATPRGSITDTKRDAEMTVEKILRTHRPAMNEGPGI